MGVRSSCFLHLESGDPENWRSWNNDFRNFDKDGCNCIIVSPLLKDISSRLRL